jgi:hypothetical protein
MGKIMIMSEGESEAVLRLNGSFVADFYDSNMGAGEEKMIYFV